MDENAKHIDLSKIRSKIQAYCDKAERAPSDVQKKLIQWGVWKEERNLLLAELITLNLLNEARFASAFANDHFQFRNWSVKKIELHLKAKGVSPRNIQDALKHLPDNADAQLIQAMLPALHRKYAAKGRLKDRYIAQALLRKGFPSTLIFKLVREIDDFQQD
jgi:regulatory protein